MESATAGTHDGGHGITSRRIEGTHATVAAGVIAISLTSMQAIPGCGA